MAGAEAEAGGGGGGGGGRVNRAVARPSTEAGGLGEAMAQTL